MAGHGGDFQNTEQKQTKGTKMYLDQIIEKLAKIERLHPVAEVVAERPADERKGEVEFEVSQVRWDAQAKKVVIDLN